MHRSAPAFGLLAVTLWVGCSSGNSAPDAGLFVCPLPDGGFPSNASLAYDGGCPSSPPVAGTSCPTLGLACTWGSDPRSECVTDATCAGTPSAALTWDIGPQASCAPLASCCPATEPSGNASCTPAELGVTCVYLGSAFTCSSSCGGPIRVGQGDTWCVTALEPGCPSLVPNLGTECATQGLVCQYNDCAAGGIAISCDDGIWQPGGGGACPE
jgi:hypothetical protein